MVELVQPVGQPPTCGDDHGDDYDDHEYDYFGHVFDEYDEVDNGEDQFREGV